MRVDIDATHVRQFAGELARFGPDTARAIVVETATTVREIAAAAQSRAPRDRPWLSTDEGIVTDVGVVAGEIRGAVFSPRDERGESVGYRQEFGTSDQAPQPFLIGAFRAGSARYHQNIGRIVDDRLRR